MQNAFYGLLALLEVTFFIMLVGLIRQGQRRSAAATAIVISPGLLSVMVAVEGFSYAEAANILGVPAGTLMSRIARGREELRGLLDDSSRRRTIRIVER